MLSECCVKALTISWIKRPCDDSFTLHMEDETTVRCRLNPLIVYDTIEEFNVDSKAEYTA